MNYDSPAILNYGSGPLLLPLGGGVPFWCGEQVFLGFFAPLTYIEKNT